MKQYATYLRVSTQRQGAQGLGISAQRDMCERFIKQNNGKHVQEFMDVESGTHRDRKGLWDAIDFCMKNDCSLVIAKLDRLARDVEFTFRVINTGIDIHFTDMPVVNSMILGVFAAVAQYEREMVSTRTKQALAAKKARGEALGANCEKWQMAYKSKAKDVLKEENARRGRTKNERYLQSQDVQALFKALRNVFPSACRNNDPLRWSWKQINTRMDAKHRIMALMKDYKELDVGGTLFQDWDFAHNDEKLNVKLSSFLHNVKASIRKYNSRKKYE